MTPRWSGERVGNAVCTHDRRALDDDAGGGDRTEENGGQCIPPGALGLGRENGAC